MAGLLQQGIEVVQLHPHASMGPDIRTPRHVVICKASSKCLIFGALHAVSVSKFEKSQYVQRITPDGSWPDRFGNDQFGQQIQGTSA